jgi:TonB family protein
VPDARSVSRVRGQDTGTLHSAEPQDPFAPLWKIASVPLESDGGIVDSSAIMNCTSLWRSAGALSALLCFALTVSCASNASLPDAPAATASASAKGATQPPTVVRRVEPLYPEELRRARFEGSVVIGGTVPKEGGLIRNLHVVSSTEPRFEQLALDAVSQWEWSPGLQDGIPVDVEFTTTVTFSLARPEGS